MMLPNKANLGATAVVLSRCALFVACVGALSGCTVWQNVRRTVITEPFQFSWKFDRNRSLRVYSTWADQAYVEYAGRCDGHLEDNDFAAGFRDGFVDYVYAGGNGEPPPVPPRRFWRVGWRSPPGHERASQWFAGFREGAAVARAGNYRNESIVHSSMYGLGVAQNEVSNTVNSVGEPIVGEFVTPSEPLPESPEAIAPEPSDPPAVEDPDPDSEPTPDAEPATNPFLEQPPADQSESPLFIPASDGPTELTPRGDAPIEAPADPFQLQSEPLPERDSNSPGRSFPARDQSLSQAKSVESSTGAASNFWK